MSETTPAGPWRILALAAVCVAVLGLGWWLLRDPSEATADGETTADSDEHGEPTGPSKRAKLPDSGKLLLGADKASVSGTVRDEQGRGIAGATVCGHADRRELLGIDDGRPRCTTSEHDGHYRLEDLWPVKLSVSASAPAFIPGRWSTEVDGRERESLHLHAGETREGVDIVLHRGGVAVRGVVRDIGGGTIDGAQVSSNSGWWYGSDVPAVATTDEDGRFELWVEPGNTALAARAEGYSAADTRVHAPTELAELFLTPESAISGVVVHAQTGATVAGVTVVAGEAGLFSHGRGSAITNDAGKFRIAGLPPGTYDLSATADELYGEGDVQVNLGLAQTSSEVVIRVHPALSVSGTVVIADRDAPCDDGAVSLERGGHEHVDATDEEGRVLIRGLLPGEYSVGVSCDDHVAEPTYAKIVLAEDSLDGLEWQVHSGLAIRGVVVDSAGAPVEGVSVSARPHVTEGADPRGQRTSSWASQSEDDGSFELSGLLAGSYALTTFSEDHPDIIDPEIVELGEAADLEGVRLTLPASGRLSGIVHDEHGTPLAGVSVVVSGLDAQWTNNSMRTADDGRFVYEHLATGSVRVRAEKSWTEGMRAPGTTDDDVQGETVQILAGQEAEVALVVESRSSSIRGRVVDSTGAPVDDAFVDATRMSDSAGAGSFASRWGMRWGWDRKPVLSEQDGSFELRELAEGEYVVRAYRKGGGEAVVEGVAAGTGGVELAIADTGQLAGNVVLAGGGSPERFDISALAKAEAVLRNDSFFRTKGAFVISALPAGTYELTVSSESASAKTEVTLAAGESIDDLRIELQPKITVVGRLVDADTRAPIPGMRVSVFPAGGVVVFTDDDEAKGERRDISDASGRFEVEDVPSGKVSVWFRPRDFMDEGGYGWTSRVMNLPAEPDEQDLGEIELLDSRLEDNQKPGDLGYKTKQLGPIEAEDRYYEIAVIRPGGPADGIGLEVGDRITKVDGRGVTGLDSHRYRPLTNAPAGTTLELTLERGVNVSLTLGPPVE